MKTDHLNARNLMVIVLRKLGSKEEAGWTAKAGKHTRPGWTAGPGICQAIWCRMTTRCFFDLALDYARAGLHIRKQLRFWGMRT